MSKKRKKRQRSPAAKQPAISGSSEIKSSDRSPQTDPDSGEERSLVEELLKHPTLFLAWVSLGITVFAIGAAIRFRDQMEMGAIREPTGSILWGAITITLFASYWRQSRHDSQQDDQ